MKKQKVAFTFDEPPRESYDPEKWLPSGRCSSCFEFLEARRHGQEVRHAETKVALNECPKKGA